MALPIALQSLIGSSLNLVDNLMVGSLGEAELASVGVAIQIFLIYWMVLFGFTSGSATFIAQFYGAQNMPNVRKTIGFALCVGMSVGVLFFIAGAFFPEYVVRIFTNIKETQGMAETYVRIGSGAFLALGITLPLTAALRATQQTQIPLYISIIAFGTNTFLNYVLIFGNFGAPKMGVAGAALSLVIARVLEMLCVLFAVFVRPNVLAGKLGDFFGWKKNFSLNIVRIALPTTINETLWGVGTTMYTAAYARVGITEFAAVQAGNVINNLFVMAAFSLGDAALILVGQRLGAGQMEYGYALAKRLLRIGTSIGVVAGLVLIAVSKPLIHFFDFSAAGERYTFYILIIYGLTMGIVLFNGINIVGVLRAGGDTQFAMFAETLCVWLIGVPLAFLATRGLHLPIYVAVLLVKTEEIVKFFILSRRFLSKKWVKNVIRDL